MQAAETLQFGSLPNGTQILLNCVADHIGRLQICAAESCFTVNANVHHLPQQPTGVAVSVINFFQPLPRGKFPAVIAYHRDWLNACMRAMR